MRSSTPIDLAEPLLGPRGTHRRDTARWSARIAMVSLGLLGLTCLLGVLKAGSCFSRGFELPEASNRLCATPVANAVLGTQFPQAPGRAAEQMPGFSPLTWWFTRAGESLGGPDNAAVVVGLMLLVNVIACAAAGIALLMLARRPEWLAVAFLSPIVLFAIGQTLDPVGLACGLWALVMLRTVGAGPRSPAGAGVLLGLAAIANPLGLVVALGLLLHLATARRGGDAMVTSGSAIITLGAAILLDGRIVGRLQAWLADGVDRGTLASLLSYQEGISPQVLTIVFTSLWILGLVAVSAVLLVRSRAAGVPVSVAGSITLLMAVSLLLMPAAPIENALWLVPFAALSIHRLWVHAGWMLAEAAMFAAVNLGDAGAIEASKGLSPSWIAIFTLLRIAALLVLVVCAWLAVASHQAEDRDGTDPEVLGFGVVKSGIAAREASGRDAGASERRARDVGGREGAAPESAVREVDTVRASE